MCSLWIKICEKYEGSKDIFLKDIGWDVIRIRWSEYQKMNKNDKEKYINDNGSLGLVQGNKYTVTFEVTKSNFGYDFVIKSIK